MINFGKIKDTFNGILVETIIKKDDKNKQLFKSYLKTIKENRMLKTQFLVYTNIENKVEPNETKAIQFVKENISLFDKFSKKDINNANISLATPLLFEQGVDIKYPNEMLHESISKLILINRTPLNIDVVLEAQDFIVKYIMNNKIKEINESIDLPLSMVSSIIVDKYNEKYESLDESDKKVLKTIIDSNDEQKKEVYSTTLRECIDLVNEKLVGSDTETKNKLLNVKDKLLNDTQEINENFITKISKLVELKTSLKSN